MSNEATEIPSDNTVPGRTALVVKLENVSVE